MPIRIHFSYVHVIEYLCNLKYKAAELKGCDSEASAIYIHMIYYLYFASFNVETNLFANVNSIEVCVTPNFLQFE